MASNQPPEIPILKRSDKKEKKGGGFLFRVLGLGGSSSSSLMSGAGRSAVGAGRVLATGGSSLSLGSLAGLGSFLTSNAGLAALAALFSGAAAYGLLASDMRGSGEGEKVRATSLFAAQEAPEGDSSQPSRPAAAEGSLDYLMSANRGLVGAQESAGPAQEASSAEAAAKGPASSAGAQAPAKEGKDKPKMVAAAPNSSQRGLGGGNGLAGGAGMSGGVSRPFAEKRLMGKYSAMRPGNGPSGAQRSLTAVRQSKSMDQLRFTSRNSRGARRAATAEGAANRASDAFEGGLGRTGKPATGPGFGSQGAELGTTDGGPLDTREVMSDPETAPEPGKSDDTSPYTNALMMGVAMLATASTIILLEGMVAQMAKIFIPLEPIAQMLAGMAAALAASAAAIGIMIMQQHGQMQQGAILTTGAAITSAAALAALVAPPETAPIVMVGGGIAGLVASIMSIVMKSRM